MTATLGCEHMRKTRSHAVAADSSVADEKKKRRLIRKNALERMARKRKGEDFDADNLHDEKKKRKVIHRDVQDERKGPEFNATVVTRLLQEQKLAMERERDAELVAWSNQKTMMLRELDATYLAIKEVKFQLRLQIENALTEKRMAAEKASLTERHKKGFVETLNFVTLSAVEEWRNKYHLERENALADRKKAAENASLERMKAAENILKERMNAAWIALTERKRVEANETQKEAEFNNATRLVIEEWENKLKLERENALREQKRAAEILYYCQKKAVWALRNRELERDCWKGEGVRARQQFDEQKAMWETESKTHLKERDKLLTVLQQRREREHQLNRELEMERNTNMQLRQQLEAATRTQTKHKSHH